MVQSIFLHFFVIFNTFLKIFFENILPAHLFVVRGFRTVRGEHPISAQVSPGNIYYFETKILSTQEYVMPWN